MAWIGAALILVLVGDIFATVFDPHAHGGPINRFQNRLLWRLLSTGCRRLPPGLRTRFLSWAAPLMAIFTPLNWAAILITAFALVYRDAAGSLRYTEAGSLSPWLAAFYFSGTAASTLGLGDVVATTDWLRLASAVEAISGFMLMTVSITYILSLYDAEHRADASALNIANLLESGADGHTLLQDPDRLEAWAEREVRRLHLVLTSLSRFPILNYFRPRDRDQSLMVQVGRLVQVLDDLEDRGGIDPARHRALSAMGRAVDAYIAGALQAFARPREDATGIAEDVDPHERRRRLHGRLMRHLCYEKD